MFSDRFTQYVKGLQSDQNYVLGQGCLFLHVCVCVLV